MKIKNFSPYLFMSSTQSKRPHMQRSGPGVSLGRNLRAHSLRGNGKNAPALHWVVMRGNCSPPALQVFKGRLDESSLGWWKVCLPVEGGWDEL